MIFLFVKDDYFTSIKIATHVTAYFSLSNLLTFEAYYRYKKINSKTKVKIYVWEIYLVAFIGFVLGHVFYGLGQFFNLDNLGGYISWQEYHLFFIKTLPIWLILMVLINSLIQNRYFSDELKRLEIINQRLEKQEIPVNSISSTSNQSKSTEELESCLDLSGFSTNLKERQSISFQEITHITVTEHYCQLFLNENNYKTQIEIRSSLKEIKNLLPSAYFIQVHRSRLININHA